MNVPRLRRFRPKWTIGTMLLVTGWSPLLIWLNIRPYNALVFKRALVETDSEVYWCYYGFPWSYAWGLDNTFPSTIHLNNMAIYSCWALAGDVVVGVVAVVLLTLVSRYLLRQVTFV